jgi:hypothetical protein
MKNLLILFLWTVSSCTSVGQRKTESFPNLSNFIDTDYAQVDNIFPIATVTLDIDGKTYKIPISYSLLHHSVDSSNFLIQGDFIDNYSFKILDNGKFKPMFKKEALLLPTDWRPYLAKTRQKVDSMKSNIDLNNYLKFLAEPDWWQNDATPLSEDGSPMKFICQLELGDFTRDDCCLFIFFDPMRKLVKQIYQRD